MKRIRLDERLIAEGAVETKDEAFIAVTEGIIFVNGQKAVSPSQPVSSDTRLEVRNKREYVGRGANKLEAALKKFSVPVAGRICADIGAATGGFTEVLLKYGAEKIYAIDTAHGKFALKLREDPRVAVMERTDVRRLEQLPEPPTLAVIDISLIPLQDILPSVARLLARGGSVVALFKPQYQTRDPASLRHGVITDSAIRESLLDDFLLWLKENRWKLLGRMESPIKGSEGNVEYLLYLAL